ncbi:MAG: CAP domain-containing protein [Planctomycetes bacterium]|nr:CAP domain-containing protein [Planctomycetota bacterium]
MTRFVVLLCACSIPALGAEAALPALPPLEPTAEEVQLLALHNRFRADPAGEAERIAPGMAGLPDLARHIFASKVDWALFHQEMKAIAPLPPLVFNLQLLDAARRHSLYMVPNGLGHDEVAGKPGFFAASPGERIRLCGYETGGGENAYRADADPWHAQRAFLVDWGGGPGGMQNGRPHRRNLANPEWKECGVSMLPFSSGRDRSITVVFGKRGGRFAGGAAYQDRNRNRAYDPGEGVAKVEVQAGEAKAVTWSSGGYAIALPAGGCELVFTSGTQRWTRTVPAGADNLMVDWRVPAAADLAAADKLLAEAAKAGDPASSGGRRALVALALGTRELPLDPEREQRIAALVGDLPERIAEAEGAALAALDAPAKEGARQLAELAKPWTGTAMAELFRAVGSVQRAQGAVEGWCAKPGAPAQHRALQKELESLLAATVQPALRTRIESLAGRLAAAAPGAKR